MRTTQQQLNLVEQQLKFVENQAFVRMLEMMHHCNAVPGKKGRFKAMITASD